MVTSRKAQIGWRKRPCESGKSGFDSHRVHQIPTIKGHEPVFHKHLGESSILSVGTKVSTGLFWTGCCGNGSALRSQLGERIGTREAEQMAE